MLSNLWYWLIINNLLNHMFCFYLILIINALMNNQKKYLARVWIVILPEKINLRNHL